MYKRILLIIIVIFLIIGGSIYISFDAKEEDKVREKQKQQQKDSIVSIYKYLDMEFNGENIIYSPLSIKSAFLMLKEGAKGETKEELDNLFSFDIPKKIKNTENLSLANTLFISNDFKASVKDSYIKTLKEKYNAEINYDDFTTPININNWVNKNTLGLIDRVLDSINPSTKLILVNALAIDLEWMNQFKTQNTTEGDFTLIDGSNYLATMMHNTYSDYASYYTDEEIKAVSLDLKKEGTTSLEFLAIMPNDITSYIKTFDNKELNRVSKKLTKISTKSKLNGKELKLRLSIPKFKFDHSLNFKKDLQDLGLNKTFTPEADFSKISKNLYVSDAIHKATIDFSEKGIKAAAVTALTLDVSSMKPESEFVEIEFNKPFVFVIRDKNTKEIWFMGVLTKPNNWENDQNFYEQTFEPEI